MKELKVIGIDVWGNAKDGWEQNDYWTIAKIEVKEFPKDKAELFKVLRKDVLMPRTRHTAYIDSLHNQSSAVRWELERNCDGKPFLIIEGLEDGKPVY